MLVKSILAATVLVSLSGVAFANSQRQREEKACQADAMKFCKDAVPDEDKIASCMGEHRTQLSVNCRIVYDRGGALQARHGARDGAPLLNTRSVSTTTIAAAVHPSSCRIELPFRRTRR